MKLALVRYGEHVDGHLSEAGKAVVVSAGEKLKPIINNKKAAIICADIPRAVECAEIIRKKLNLLQVQSFQELYAAEEEDISINLQEAKKIIDSIGAGNDVIIAVISREYIEALPQFILGASEKTNLNRGEVLVLDYDTQSVGKL